MVLGKLPVPGRPTIWITVGQGPTALAVGAGGGCLDIFTLIYPFSPLSPSLWETARYRLKYCLKGPLNPNQPTNQPTVKRHALSVLSHHRLKLFIAKKNVITISMVFAFQLSVQVLPTFQFPFFQSRKITFACAETSVCVCLIYCWLNVKHSSKIQYKFSFLLTTIKLFLWYAMKGYFDAKGI